MIVAAQHSGGGYRWVPGQQGSGGLRRVTPQDQHSGENGERRVRNPFARAGGPADRRGRWSCSSSPASPGTRASSPGTLSYGQRKLLELSYVLVADPAIVLLDEPAGGINPSLVNQLADRIRQLNAAGKTFLIVEHNMEFVMDLCHHIAVLDFGTIVATGPPSVVRNDPRVLDAYLGTAEGGDEPGAGETDERTG